MYIENLCNLLGFFLSRVHRRLTVVAWFGLRESEVNALEGCVWVNRKTYSFLSLSLSPRVFALCVFALSPRWSLSKLSLSCDIFFIVFNIFCRLVSLGNDAVFLRLFFFAVYFIVMLIKEGSFKH